MERKFACCVTRCHQPTAAALIFLIVFSLAIPAWSLPTDYTVEQGSVSAETSGDTQTFQIDSPQAILSFSKFDIAPSETVNFNFRTGDPAASSVLSRVTGGRLSTIAGVLLSNGRVFLVNPAGIQITGTARINTAGFVASTLNISNEDFLSKNYRFFQDPNLPPAEVLNQGRILARPGDIVALLGGSVSNAGFIVAKTGTVALAAGEQVTLSFDQDGLLAVAVVDPLTQVARGKDGQLVTSAIEQSGEISAPGGHVLIQARAVEQLFNRLIVLPAGVIEAVSSVFRNGRIELVGEGGGVELAGWLAANAGEGQKAGEIQVTGDDVLLAPGSRLEAKATGENGEGGSVRVVSTHPKESGSISFQPGSMIDVSGGSVSGDAGSVELSAAEVDYSGQIAGVAAPGSQGGKLLVDPLFVTFNNTVRPAPPNNPDGTPDVAFGDAPAAGTTFVYIASILGFSEAFFQAVNDITVNRDITMDAGNSLKLESGRDTFINANVRMQGAGKVTITADADFSGAGGAVSDGIGSIAVAAGKSIQSDSGAVNLSAGGDLTMADTSSMTTGSGNVTLHSGGKMELQKITSTSGDLKSTAGTDWTAFSDVTTGGAGAISTQAGGILVVKQSLTADTGPVTLESGARLDVIRVASNSGDVKLDAGQDLIVRDSTVTGGAGSVSLKANDSVALDGFYHALVRASGTGTLTVEAGRDGTGQVLTDPDTQMLTGSGDLAVTAPGALDLNQVGSTSGNIQLTSGDNITAHANITTGGAGSVTAKADGALAVDAGATLIRANGTGDVTLTAGADGTGPLTMNAGSTAQTVSGPLALNSGSDMILAKAISGSGGITVNSGKAVTLNDTLVTGGAGKVLVQANGGTLDVAAGGSVRSSAGDVELDSAGLMTVSNTIITAGGNVALNGANGIDLNALNADAMTAGGKFTANADSDANHTGTFSQSDAGSVVNTSGGEVSISGDKVDLNGAVRSGVGQLGLTSTGGLMTVAGTLETTGAEMVLSSANGIQLDGPTSITTAGGKFTANADSDGNHTGDFNQSDAGSVVNTAGGALTVSGNRVMLGGTLRSGLADMRVTATGGFMTVANTLETLGGKMALDASEGIQLNGSTDIRTTGGVFLANANTNGDNTGAFDQTDPLSVVNTTGGSLTITARDMALAGTLRSGAGEMALTATRGAVTASHLLETTGSAMNVQAANGITLSGAAVRTNGGAFSANANSDANDSGDFSQTGGVINAGAGVISISGYKADTSGTLDTGLADIAITGTGGTVRIANAVTTLGGRVEIRAADGVTLDGADADIRSNGGDVAINANTDLDADGSYFETNGGSLIDTGGGSLAITANDFGMDGTHRAVGNTVSLLPALAGVPIHLGFSLHTNGEVNVKDGESDRIFADTIVIGDAGSGNFLVGDYSPANVNTLILRTGGAVLEEGVGDSLADVIVPNLGIRSVGGVNLDVDAARLAIRNDGVGALNVEDTAGGMAVGTVGGIAGVSTLGGDITLTSAGTLTMDLGAIIGAAGSGNVSILSGEDILMGGTSRILSEDGNLLVDAARDLLLGVLNADSDNDGVVGDVTTFSRFGRTTDANGDALNITAKNLRMYSYRDIGSKKDPIDISRDAKINKPARSSFLVYPGLPLLDSDRYIKAHK